VFKPIYVEKIVQIEGLESRKTGNRTDEGFVDRSFRNVDLKEVVEGRDSKLLNCLEGRTSDKIDERVGKGGIRFMCL
jgi:hypothetical protein